MKDEESIYLLTIEDVQKVALEVLDRKLTEEEVDKISDRVGDYIPWYDAIENSINDVIQAKVDKS